MHGDAAGPRLRISGASLHHPTEFVTAFSPRALSHASGWEAPLRFNGRGSGVTSRSSVIRSLRAVGGTPAAITRSRRSDDDPDPSPTCRGRPRRLRTGPMGAPRDRRDTYFSSSQSVRVAATPGGPRAAICNTREATEVLACALISSCAREGRVASVRPSAAHRGAAWVALGVTRGALGFWGVRLGTHTGRHTAHARAGRR